MKKIICVLIVLTMCLSVIAGCTKQAPAVEDTGTQEPTQATAAPAADTAAEPAVETAAKPQAKIGIVATLAADGRINGYYHAVAMDMVQDELEGRDLGVDFEFVLRDMGTDASEMKQRMSELKDLGCVAIMALCSDDYGPAAAQWASENKTPVLFAANYSTQMTIVNYSDYIFGTGLNAWGFIKVLADEAVNKRGYKTYAYVGTDGAGAIDAENLLLYEGQKFNPDFKCVASYRMSHTDTEFSTIVSTIMNMDPIPEMTLQQGGYNVISFIMQAAMYDFYDSSTIWSDVVIMPSIVTALVEADVYSYEGSYGASTFAWWDEDFADFYKGYSDRCVELYNEAYAPMDFSLYSYWAGIAATEAISACVKAGTDFTNGEVLKDALANVSFESCGSTHSFRDFDHQLSMNLYFVEAVDAGEEFNHIPKPADPTAVYTAEQYLPTKEEMKTYGETVLNVFDRF